MFGNLSLRQRLLTLTALALMPAVVILFYNEISLRQSREAEIHRTALRVGQLASLEMQRIFVGAENTLAAMARAPVVRSFDPAQCESYLAEVMAENPQFTAIAAVDSGGLLHCRSLPGPSAVMIGDRPYFLHAMQNNAFVVGEYTESRISGGQPVLPLAVSIRNTAGDAIGVLVADLSLDWLGGLLAERVFPENDSLTIADRNGVIIARQPFPERFVGTRIPDDFLHLVTADEPGTMRVTSQDGTERIIGYHPVSSTPAQIYVSAGVSRDAAMQPVNDATRRGALIVLAGALLAFLLAWLAGTTLLQGPVSRILATVQAWRDGNDSARTGMTASASELNRIGVAIDAFMDELVTGRAARREAEMQRDLLARELQHRTKNTLATVQAIAAQTFRKGEPLEQAQRSFAERLAAIGRAQQLLTESEWKSADLASMVRGTLEPFEAGQFEISGPSTEINEKATLALSMVVHELATNAAKYGALSHPGGRVLVDWQIGDGDDFVFRWIEQDGPPAVEPVKKGFGTRMIERVLAAELSARVQLKFPETGVQCRIEAPASAVALA